MLQPSYLAAKPADQPADEILLVSEQVQRELVEIDRASAILRNAQPDLEAWPSQTVEAAPTPKPRPVWFVIGAVWISTVFLTAMATLAIAALVS